MTMNESLRFPVLTLCNKNMFNISRIRRLMEEMKAEETEHSDDWRNRSGTTTAAPATTKPQKAGGPPWDVGKLIGFRGMNIQQVWDAVAHDIDKIILEVGFIYLI